jgi:hypothetical protein
MTAWDAKEFAMIPYDVDPSLHNTEPHEAQLDDGFSPPEVAHPASPEEQPSTVATPPPVDPQLWDKSDF